MAYDVNTEELEEKIAGVAREGAEFQTPEDKQLLHTWEQQLKDIKASASFLEHPETHKLLALVEGEISRINGKLQNQREMTAAEREGLFETRDFCDKVKSFLDRDPEKMMDKLEEDIDSHVWRSGEADDDDHNEPDDIP